MNVRNNKAINKKKQRAIKRKKTGREAKTK
jgi:hypothetical protein